MLITLSIFTIARTSVVRSNDDMFKTTQAANRQSFSGLVQAIPQLVRRHARAICHRKPPFQSRLPGVSHSLIHYYTGIVR